MIADYLALLTSLVPDQAEAISPADRTQALGLALVRYGSDAERRLVRDVVWDQAGYLGPMPEGWVAGSYLQDAEYPLGQEPRAVIDLAVYLTPDSSYLQAAEPLPLGAVVRVSFAAPHVVTDVMDSVPLVHREAVCSYAAYVLCQMLATRFSGERDSMIAADHANTDGRSRAYAARAKEYRTAYFAGLGRADPFASGGGSGSAGGGVAPGQQAAASVSSWGGRDRLGLAHMGLPL